MLSDAVLFMRIGLFQLPHIVVHSEWGCGRRECCAGACKHVTMVAAVSVANWLTDTYSISLYRQTYRCILLQRYVFLPTSASLFSKNISRTREVGIVVVQVRLYI